MIQRRQTLYLLTIVILGVVLFFVPVLQLTSPETAGLQRMFYLGAEGLEEITPELEFRTDLPPVTMNGLWGLTVATVLIPLLALVDIFLYKNRILQARLNIFLVMLCLGYYGVLALYIWLATMSMNVEWHILPYASFPLICMVLTLMATRRILKDEALVRAADRIR